MINYYLKHVEGDFYINLPFRPASWGSGAPLVYLFLSTIGQLPLDKNRWSFLS